MTKLITISFLVCLIVALVLICKNNPYKSDVFDGNLTIEEAASFSKSSSKDWWVSSGALFEFSGGIGKTIQGDLPADNKWRKLYETNKPSETDKGLHPQNIFRLVRAKELTNFRQESYFLINRYNLSRDVNRNESNGIFLFNRYIDSNDVYYAGIRVDGMAVIKKKINGSYMTLAEKKIINGNYDRESNPNLLPVDKWIGLKSEVQNVTNGVSLVLSVDFSNQGRWEEIIKITDNNNTIRSTGHGGIRTDFMDVEFKKYIFEDLKLSRY